MITKKISTAAHTQLTATNAAQILSHLFETNGESREVIQGGCYSIAPEDGDIRIFWDGNTPTSSLGMLLQQGQWLTLTEASQKISFIRAGSSNVKVNVQAGQSIVGGRN